MKKTKLTVWVSRDLLENGRRYAAQNNTTLDDLIEAYIRHVITKHSLENAPIVSRLSGVLPQSVNILDHKKHHEEKYNQ